MHDLTETVVTCPRASQNEQIFTILMFRAGAPEPLPLAVELADEGKRATFLQFLVTDKLFMPSLVGHPFQSHMGGTNCTQRVKKLERISQK